MKLNLEQIPIESIISFDFLRYDHKEEMKLNAQEHNILSLLAFDLFRLDFYSYILHNCSEYKASLNALKKDNIGDKLYTKPIQVLGLNLSLKRISEISFLLNLPNTIHYYSHQNLNSENIPFPLPFESKDTISKAKADDLQLLYENFLKKWIPTTVFYLFYIFPPKKTLDVPESAKGMWQAFKADLSLIYGVFNQYFTITETNTILYFWLFHLSKINTIGEFITPNKDFEQNLKTINLFIDEQNDQIYNSIDFLGTSFGMNFLYHYLDLAVYPVNPTKYIKAPKENFYSDLYGRFSKVLFIKEKEKQELLLESCTNPHLISEDRLVKIFRFLYHFTGSHIKGYVGELFALPLLRLCLSEQLDHRVIIPGGAIQVNNLQGPDGLIARLFQNEENEYSLQISGIVEIKAKKTSKSKLLKQLQNHHHRLQDTSAQISLHIAEGDVLTFISPMLYITPPTYQTIVVSEISFSEHIQYYTIVPPAKSAQKADSFIAIPLFWSEEGFNRITFGFLKWVVENFGRTIDPYNYDIGVENWIENLKILKDSSLLTKAERKLASNFLIFLEGDWQNPDDELQTLNVQ